MKFSLALLGLLFTVGTTVAQSGKLSGVIVDEGSTPLFGASVFISELDRGVAANVDGEYTLLSIPVGVYDVRVSSIGFATKIFTNVEINSGQTTRLDVVLETEAFEGEEVTVVAQKPIVQKDLTSSVSFVSAETIEKLPALEVSDLVRFQPGVVATDGGFSFRGGRTREVAYLIDGIPVQNVYSQGGGNTVDIEVQSVQELQVLTGTFDAELGGAQSGVVNVTTKDPSDRFRASISTRSGGYFSGDDELFVDGDLYNPVESKDLSVTVSGPLNKRKTLGFFITGRYEDRVSHLKGVRRFTIEDGARIDAYKFWYRNRFSPDDARLISLDEAKTPSGDPILDSQGNPIIFANGDGEVVNMSWSESYTINPKVVLRPIDGLKLTLSAIYNQREGQGYNDGKRYAPDGRGLSKSNSLTTIVTARQTFGNNKVLNLRGSFKNSSSRYGTYESFDDPRYTYFSSSDDETGFYFGGTENGRSTFDETQLILSGDFTWQINFSNEIKTGFQFRTNTFTSKNNSIGWYLADDPDRKPVDVVRPGNASSYRYFDEYYEAVKAIELARAPFRDLTGETREFENQPFEFAAFIQDKLEFENSLVVKAGLRFEYYDTQGETILNTREQAMLIGESSNLNETQVKTYFSPRIGISYPISDRGAFRVAYGHFTQMPAYGRLFQNPVDENTNQGRLSGTTIGNPDLEPERTIKYELGLQQQLNDFIGLDINLFYKNVRNLLGLEVLSTSDGIFYNRTVNRDYGLIKGGTLSLYTNPTGYLFGAGFDITYQDVRGSSSDPNAIADVIVAGRRGEIGDVFVDRRLIYLNWNQPLTANTYLTIGVPDNWNIGFVQQIASGQPYTPTFIDPTKDFPDFFFDNTENKPFIFTLDITAEKQFNIGDQAIKARLQVNNVLNHLNERSVNSVSGRADQIVRLAEDEVDRSIVNDYVGLFTNEDQDLRPTWYSTPRQILFSIQLNL